MSDDLLKGTRVRLSEKGRASFPLRSARHGIVTSMPRRAHLRSVIWDGTKTPQTIHISFIELAPRAEKSGAK